MCKGPICVTYTNPRRGFSQLHPQHVRLHGYYHLAYYMNTIEKVFFYMRIQNNAFKLHMRMRIGLRYRGYMNYI